ncbi:MAG TPA: PAS domain-containing sensor histidine kinase [Abditibacteriaceae bacterium]|nr:PAS domain-containing sensor histidine kinase [Abditibacteriaceae bacterium]
MTGKYCLPAMTTTQLRALLEALPEAVRVYDGTGAVVAQNQAALHSSWLAAGTESLDLGDGWRLSRHKPVPPDSRSSLVQTAPETMEAATHPVDIDILAQGIVHEIRNPLAAILTGVRLVQDDLHGAEETAMLLGVIRKESLRINDILSAFATYVKPPPPHPANFDLAQVARETIEELRREEILSPAVVVEDALEPPLMVWADEAHFRSALFHILQNAADAMQYDEAVRLSSQTKDRRVIFFVDDNGPGLSEESLRRAFQPFYSTKPQAIGLGLPLAQAVVHASGGRVWIQNLSDHFSSPRPAPGAPALGSKEPGGPSLNGVSPRLQGARACIELPTAPNQT